MAMIEGVGDEVTWCLALVAVIVILILAWISTDVSFNRSPGSVWLVQMQTFPHRRILQILSLDNNPLRTEGSQLPNSIEGQHQSPSDSTISSQTLSSSDATTGTQNPPQPQAQNRPSSIVEESSGNDSATAGQDIPDEEEQIVESVEAEKSVSAPPKDSMDNQGEGNVESSQTMDVVSDDTSQPELADGTLSQIRLKFLDETLRLVDAELSQTVGDFKKRHFPEEVRVGKIIRLIFNGQLLRDDSRSLASYGLFSECVVHCHVSNTPLDGQGRTAESTTGLSSGQSPQSTVHYVNGGTTRLEFLQAGSMGFPSSFGIGGHSHHRHAHASTTAGLHEGGLLNLGQHVYLIFGIKFALLWSAWFVYPEYFDFTALFTLFLCSVVYGGFLYASRRRSQMVATGGNGTGSLSTALTATGTSRSDTVSEGGASSGN